jgi:hypothetical protein
MSCALFMANENMADGARENWIVGWQNRTAWDSKHDINAGSFK